MTDQQLPDHVEIIKPEAVIPVDMSTGYYQRIQHMVTFLVQDKSQQELEAAHAQITTGEGTIEWAKHYETLLILCKEFEMQARERGFVEQRSLADLA
jgi:hypothetical protein